MSVSFCQDLSVISLFYLSIIGVSQKKVKSGADDVISDLPKYACRQQNLDFNKKKNPPQKNR